MVLYKGWWAMMILLNLLVVVRPWIKFTHWTGPQAGKIKNWPFSIFLPDRAASTQSRGRKQWFRTTGGHKHVAHSWRHGSAYVILSQWCSQAMVHYHRMPQAMVVGFGRFLAVVIAQSTCDPFSDFLSTEILSRHWLGGASLSRLMQQSVDWDLSTEISPI